MFTELLQQLVIIDTDSNFAYVGELVETSDHFVRLRGVSIYDRHEARISLDKFVVECATYGAPAAREEILVLLPRVVAVSRLSDVILP